LKSWCDAAKATPRVWNQKGHQSQSVRHRYKVSNLVKHRCPSVLISISLNCLGSSKCDSRSLIGRPALALIRPLSRFQGAPDDHQSSGRQLKL